MKCPNCGVDLPEESLFCFDCGAAIASQPPQPPPPVYSQEARQIPGPVPAFPPMPSYTPPPPPQYTTPMAADTASQTGMKASPRQRTGRFLAIRAVVAVFLLLICGVGAYGLYQFYFSGNQTSVSGLSPSEVVGQTRQAIEAQRSLIIPTTTPKVEMPCSNGALLLADNFNSDPPVARPFFSAPYMSFSQNQQSGIIQSGSSPSVVLPVVYPTLMVADFNIEFSAFPLNINGDGSYGVIFHATQANNDLSKFYLLTIFPNLNIAEFSMWINPNWSEVKRVDMDQDVLGKGGGSQVHLEVLRDHFRLFVNNHFVTTFQSATLGNPGLIGLVLLPSPSAATSPEQAWFGELMIFKPGGCP